MTRITSHGPSIPRDRRLKIRITVYHDTQFISVFHLYSKFDNIWISNDAFGKYERASPCVFGDDVEKTRPVAVSRKHGIRRLSRGNHALDGSTWTNFVDCSGQTTVASTTLPLFEIVRSAYVRILRPQQLIDVFLAPRSGFQQLLTTRRGLLNAGGPFQRFPDDRRRLRQCVDPDFSERVADSFIQVFIILIILTFYRINYYYRELPGRVVRPYRVASTSCRSFLRQYRAIPQIQSAPHRSCPLLPPPTAEFVYSVNRVEGALELFDE